MLTVAVLRELLRNLQALEALFESSGKDVIPGPDGETYHLMDIVYLSEQLWRLSPRQAQSIRLCLLDNIKERDAAVMMGLSPTNPVAMYATDGLAKLVQWANDGTLPRFQDTEAEV